MKQQNTKIVSLVLLLILSVGLVSAITGSMGNARMILRVETGDLIEKYILVKNVNDVPLDIELSPAGDLAEDIEIIDDKFSLGPGTEKKAYFNIKVKEEGTTESTINVKFTPEEGGNGVGLSSTVIVIAKEGEGWWEDDYTNDDSDDVDGGVSVITGNAVSDTKRIFEGVSFGVILVIGLVLIFFVLLGVLLFMLRGLNKPKKSSVLESG